MTDLFADYEKQFGVLSSDITAKIAKIPNLANGMKKVLFYFIIVTGPFSIFFYFVDEWQWCAGILSSWN